jgi:CheY-like chemotaxis protein
LGGDVVLAKSVVGTGSTFVVTIDAGESFGGAPVLAQNLPVGKALTPTAPRAKPLAGVTVLLAEDAPDNQFMINAWLSRQGAAVDIVDNGADAVKQATRRPYDLILMDIQMPVQDGCQAAKKLREKGFTKPILALTAHAMQEDREASLRSGFDDHITKPINYTQLLDALMRCSKQTHH